MKKIFTLIFSIGFIIIIGYGTCNSKFALTNISPRKDRLDLIKENGKLTFISANDPPFAYVNPETKKLSGIDADIIVEITKRLGINNIEMKEAQFSELLDKLNTDDSIDVAANAIFITPEREEIVSFTQPLYKESEVVVVPKASKINFKDDLKNAVVGVEKGTKFEDLVQGWKKKNLIKDVAIFDRNLEVLNAVNSGKIDAAVSDSSIAKYALNNNNFFFKTLRDYTPELYGTVGIAVRKNDITLLNALNETISQMKADDTLHAILLDNGLDNSNLIEGE
ncbi:ABC transporter substrate-binding protein [Clostridium sp. C2-6-12]|uniref:ABC transporter substrate-binding protein n=1 Tax=Clostridium sp. C2-6-12 TaxID=2698832 RepID=UPI001370E113|nr:ABC transporter substrate-binding protein [Clostridium sp. C2-6-12]